MDPADATLSTEALHATWLQSLDAKTRANAIQIERLRAYIGLVLLLLVAIAFYRLGKGRLAP